MSRVRFGVVGSGAQADLTHFPVLAQSERAELTAVVDRILPRAEEMARKYGAGKVFDDYRALEGEVDAAIVVLPNNLHAQAVLELLRRGIHVLVEKPMALTTADCDAMIDAAEQHEVVLAVGLELRFFRQCQFVKRALDFGWLGEIVAVDLRMGHATWRYAVQSDYLLHKDKAGGGALMDFGVHAIDLLLWWLGELELIGCWHDAHGGVEANCEVHLRLPKEAEAIVELSRLRQLRNTCLIRGTRGQLEVEFWHPAGEVRMSPANGDEVLHGQVTDEPDTWKGVYQRQLENFIDATLGLDRATVSGSEGRHSVRLIEQCYAQAQVLRYPWDPEASLHAAERADGKGQVVRAV